MTLLYAPDLSPGAGRHPTRGRGWPLGRHSPCPRRAGVLGEASPGSAHLLAARLSDLCISDPQQVTVPGLSFLRKSVTQEHHGAAANRPKAESGAPPRTGRLSPQTPPGVPAFPRGGAVGAVPVTPSAVPRLPTGAEEQRLPGQGLRGAGVVTRLTAVLPAVARCHVCLNKTPPQAPSAWPHLTLVADLPGRPQRARPPVLAQLLK